MVQTAGRRKRTRRLRHRCHGNVGGGRPVELRKITRAPAADDTHEGIPVGPVGPCDLSNSDQTERSRAPRFPPPDRDRDQGRVFGCFTDGRPRHRPSRQGPGAPASSRAAQPLVIRTSPSLATTDPYRQFRPRKQAPGQNGHYTSTGPAAAGARLLAHPPHGPRARVHRLRRGKALRSATPIEIRSRQPAGTATTFSTIMSHSTKRLHYTSRLNRKGMSQGPSRDH